MSSKDTGVSRSARKALEQFREEVADQIGGVPKKPEKKINTSKVTVERGETSKIILPDGLDTNDGIKLLQQHAKEETTTVGVHIPINCFPLDGAVALTRLLQDVFGWTQLVPTPGFFGDTPPTMVTTDIGFGETTQIPWGSMKIPGIAGTLQTGVKVENNRLIFALNGQVQRKHEDLVKALGDAVRDAILTGSIYRGKAIELNYRDQDGDPKNIEDCSVTDGPKFLDLSNVRREELVFPELTERLIQTTLFNLIEHTKTCVENQIPLKRGVLLEGPFGTGKTLCAYVLAKMAVDNGWTFIYLKDVRDLDKAIEFAKIYQPAVIFAEDVDVAVGNERDAALNSILNILDGVTSKTDQILTVLTTNNLEKISPAMIRPGRIDAIIPVRPPDAAAAYRLIRTYARGKLQATQEEVEKAVGPILGVNASILREVVERAKLSAIARPGKLTLTAEDIEIAALSMREHTDLLRGRPTPPTPGEKFAKTFGTAVGENVAAALVAVAQIRDEQTLDNPNGPALPANGKQSKKAISANSQ